PMITIPSQKAEKLPATSPERMLSEAPPSREEDTTSRTCAECVDVNTLTISGMMAPARVPQVMTSESCHQRSVFPARSGITTFDTTNVSATDRREVSQTSEVSGASKLNLTAFR